jgi:hypothetical protein
MEPGHRGAVLSRLAAIALPGAQGGIPFDFDHDSRRRFVLHECERSTKRSRYRVLLSHTRFWELLRQPPGLVDGLREGLFCSRPDRDRQRVRRVGLRETAGIRRQTAGRFFSLAGLLLLLAGFFLMDSGWSFPGYWAAVPVSGAVLIIAAGPEAWLNRTVLSHPLAVWFGLISYSLYLWHWPLLSFTRIVGNGFPGTAVRIEAPATAVVLAWLTYKRIERPVRLDGRRGKARMIVLLTLMSVVGCPGVRDLFEGRIRFSPGRDLEGLRRPRLLQLPQGALSRLHSACSCGRGAAVGGLYTLHAIEARFGDRRRPYRRQSCRAPVSRRC